MRSFLLMLLLALYMLPASAQKVNSMQKPTSGYAEVNGINMYYEIYGNGAGTPLLLIHGGGSTIQSSFGNFLPLLKGYGKVIAVELQAHGRTSDRPAAESFEQDADDVAALLNHLKISKANVLGFSNGGTTTLQLAVRHPQLVNKIIVVAGTYKRDGLIAGFFDSMPHATLSNMPQPLKDAYLKVSPSQSGLQTMFEKDKQRMLGFKDMSDEQIKSIKAPALFVVGDKDVITPEHTLQMSRTVVNGQLVILPGVHGACLGEVCSAKPGSQQPAVMATLVKEFLSE